MMFDILYKILEKDSWSLIGLAKQEKEQTIAIVADIVYVFPINDTYVYIRIYGGKKVRRGQKHKR